MKTGTNVTLKQPVAPGVVLGQRISGETDEPESLVAFTDPATGEAHQRWFPDTQLTKEGAQ